MESHNVYTERVKMKKILPYILILIVLVGLFKTAEIARADDEIYGTCTVTLDNGVGWIVYDETDEHCKTTVKMQYYGATRADFDPYSESNQDPDPDGDTKPKYFSKTQSPLLNNFEQKISEDGALCKLAHPGSGSWQGCILQTAYYIIYLFGALLLYLAALLFNFLIIYTLNSELLNADFISSSWGIVRDISNIFFILILLYIAIKIILDFGGSEAKRMIAKVIIIALLINFSMFFTKVVIDSSNILALIFYNKINPTTSTPDEQIKAAIDLNGKADIAGGLTKSFNPAYKLNKEFFEGAGGQIRLKGISTEKESFPTSILIGITIISGAIMIFAAYALFIASLSFLGRLIELFILIIFSPFAFMSSTIPLLSGAEYLGWDNWFKRLLKVAFMAPIFMFFLYFIFLLISKNASMFTSAVKGEGFWVPLLNLIIPALIILILLKKATEFAKKGSGALGEAIIKGAKITAGLGLGIAGGLAIGGIAKGMQAGGGFVGEKILKSTKLADYEGAKKEDQTGRFRGLKAGLKRSYGRRLRTIAGGADADGKGGMVGSEFDLRKTAVSGLFKGAEKVTGLNFGAMGKVLVGHKGGGHRGDMERAQEKRDKRGDALKAVRDEPLQQKLYDKEEQKQLLMNETSHEIKQSEIRRQGARENMPEFEHREKATRSAYEISKNKLNAIPKGVKENNYDAKKADFEKITRGTDEADYDTKKAKFDEIIASGITSIDPVYIAAESAYNVAKATADTAYVAAKVSLDAAKSAANTTYVAAKDTNDTHEKDWQEANEELKERADNLRELTKHRSKIKDEKALVDTSGNIDMVANEAKLATTKAALTIQEGLLATAKIEENIARGRLEAAKDSGTATEITTTQTNYDTKYMALKTIGKTEEAARKAKELAVAALASAKYGDGNSINTFEDKIIPDIEEEIENKNRERLTAEAERVRGKSTLRAKAAKATLDALIASGTPATDPAFIDAIIANDNAIYWSKIANAFRTLFTRPGDNQASRNAAAHKIIMEVKNKKI